MHTSMLRVPVPYVCIVSATTSVLELVADKTYNGKLRCGISGTAWPPLQTNRQTDRQTDRQSIHSYIHTHIDIDTDIYI